MLATTSPSGLITETSAPPSGPSWLPWVIVAATIVILAAVVLLARRSRRRFERTHHVQDEHGQRIDPARLLDDSEIEDAADRALIAVDNAVLASSQELERTDGVPEAESALQRAADELAAAFTLRDGLDRGEPADDAGRRRVASDILDACERADDLLDAAADAFIAARALPAAMPGAIDSVRAELDDLVGRASADALVDTLLQAASHHLDSAASKTPDDQRKAVGHLRVAEQAVDQARTALDASGTDDESLRIATLMATRRGAVGALARARWRHDATGAPALEQAESDIATWRPEHPRQADAELKALLLAGVLVPAGHPSWRTALGGSSHGEGGNTPFRGSARTGRLVAAGFGGRRATEARPTIVRT